MEDNILIDSETFEEFPDKYLQIKNNSKYYYIKKGEDTYIARRNVDFVSYDGIGEIRTKIGYYDVFNNNLIATCCDDKNPVGLVLIQLSEVLRLKENCVYNFTKEDVNALLGFTQEKTRYKRYLYK